MIKRIPEIIAECVARLKPFSDITGITDNSNNTYTIQYAAFSNIYLTLRNNNIIEIIGTAGFNGKYKISNLTATSFDIQLISGVAIPSFGVWSLSCPFYYFSDVKEYADKISQEHNRNLDVEKELFPAVYLNPNMKYTEINKVHFQVENVKITLLDWTIIDSNYPQRYANEMPYLFELYDKLNEQITLHEAIMFPSFAYEPFCFAELKENETVNAIEITINTKIRIIKNNC